MKLSLIVGSTTLAATTATFLYAKYDDAFRNQLISAAPPIKFLFEEDVPKKEPVPQSFMRPKPAPAKIVETKKEAPKVDVSPAVPVPQAEPKPQKVEAKPSASEIKAEIANAFDKAIEEENVSCLTFGSL